MCEYTKQEQPQRKNLGMKYSSVLTAVLPVIDESSFWYRRFSFLYSSARLPKIKRTIFFNKKMKNKNKKVNEMLIFYVLTLPETCLISVTKKSIKKF